MDEEGVYNKNDIEETKDRMSGVDSKADDVCSVLEAHMHLEIPGYEDIDPKTNESTGIKFPYIITVKEDTAEVLSIKRNWNETDLTKKRQDYFVHFKFLPGLGFYGFGLIHMIGGLSRTATAALRQLLDVGTLSNLLPRS